MSLSGPWMLPPFSMHCCSVLHAPTHDLCRCCCGLLCAAQPSFSAEKAIPLGAVGVLVTCDAGRDRKAAAEMTSLFEEVRLCHRPAADCKFQHTVTSHSSR